MRTSHVQIAKLVNDEKSKITEEQLFSSAQFTAYLMDIAEAASKRYKRPVKVQLYWDAEDDNCAYTDNQTIVINSANPFTAVLSSKADKADSLVGLLAHELGHVNYTCFAMMQAYFQSLSIGKFKPAVTGLKKEEKQAKLALEQYFKDNNQVAAEVIQKIAHRTFNIIEDAYIESRISYDFPGRFAYAIQLNRRIMFNASATLQEQLDQGVSDLAIIQNMLLQYCLYGQVKNPEKIKGALWEKLVECAPVMDDAKYDDDVKCRLKAASVILLKLWPYVEETIRAVSQQQQSQAKVGETENGENTAGESKENVNSVSKTDHEMDTEAVQTAVKEYLTGLEPISQEPVGKGDSVKLGEALPDAAGQFKSTPEADEAAPIENPPRIPLTHTDTVTDGSDGGIEHNNYYEISGYNAGAYEIEKLLTTIAAEIVKGRQEEVLSAELQAEANRIDYGNAHRGVRINVNRMVNVPENLVVQYQQVAPALNLIAEQMVKKIKAVLPQESGGSKHSYRGKRLVPRTLIHNDGKYFRLEKLPQEPERLAVALVVDESTSMSGKRIAAARAASIVLYRFCETMEIPIAVVGHTEDHGKVELYAYAEFDSLDDKDKYRLMAIQARHHNRDGAALRYAAERLMNRPEKKILIILSDGQPCGIGYKGTAAEADMRGIVQEYTRKGILFLAGAIGDDKPAIERIYKKGYLDLSDLQKLPYHLTKLMQQYLI